MEKNLLTKTLKRLLAPAVRFCLRHALHVQDIEALVKEVLIEQASIELEGRGQKVNISRLSAATGLHRRDVMRLAGEDGEQKPAAPRTVEGKGLISRVIGRWQFDKKFLTPTHRPRTLTVGGADSEFNELVRSVSNDLNAGTVLRELERVGAVERTARGIKLITHVYQSKRDAVEGFRMLGEDLCDLTGSVEENIAGQSDVPNLHARTEFDNIYVDALPQIREWLLRRGTEFHAAAREYLASFDRDFAARSDAGRSSGARVVIGTFSLTADEKAAAANADVRTVEKVKAKKG